MNQWACENTRPKQEVLSFDVARCLYRYRPALTSTILAMLAGVQARLQRAAAHRRCNATSTPSPADKAMMAGTAPACTIRSWFWGVSREGEGRQYAAVGTLSWDI